MAKNPVLDFEDSLKNLVSGPVLKSRTEVCNNCEFAGASKICAKNFEHIPTFIQYRYNECPEDKWPHGWNN